MDGTGSTWTSRSSLFVGSGGTGTLDITNRGSVSSNGAYLGFSSGASGTVTVNGTGSTWTDSGDILVGDMNMSSGKLKITKGGIANTSDCILGFRSGSSGIATVDGTGSTWTNGGSLSVGCGGTGTLDITTGGTVIAGNHYIGEIVNSSGSTTVDGAGSKLRNNNLWVGDRGSGTLHIANGGSVSTSTDSYLGTSSGSSGTVTVDGDNSTWTCTGSLNVGSSGTGTVLQTGGATSVGNTLALGISLTGNGTYNLNGGTLVLKSLAKGSGTATFNFGGGTLQASGTMSSSLPMTLTGTGGNANVDTNGYPVALSGILSGAGGLKKLGANTLTLSAANSYTGRTTVMAGTIEFAPAAQNAVFTLGGADIQLGKMVFDYNGTTSPAATILQLADRQLPRRTLGRRAVQEFDGRGQRADAGMVRQRIERGDGDGDLCRRLQPGRERRSRGLEYLEGEHRNRGPWDEVAIGRRQL